MKATITSIIHETPHVLTFVVRLEKPVTFQTGQSMRLGLPGVQFARLYSIASPGGRNISELWFTIRILDDGRFTSHLPSLKAGDSFDIQGPFGKFVFDEKDTHDIALIAGGSGISVMRSIWRYVLENKMKNNIHLLFSVMTVNDVIYKKELEDLAKKYPQFTYTIIVTEAAPEWNGACGLITKKLFDETYGGYKQTFYVCGPPKFIECAEGILHESQVPEERIRIDRWVF